MCPSDERDVSDPEIDVLSRDMVVEVEDGEEEEDEEVLDDIVEEEEEEGEEDDDEIVGELGAESTCCGGCENAAVVGVDWEAGEDDNGLDLCDFLSFRSGDLERL